ncbi:MAG: methyltransferase domain-containing protein [Alphaproteobacteria bacterium]|nr:methyltransferase domain-containing protein [Alphaproteobacteria bacterium]
MHVPRKAASPETGPARLFDRALLRRRFMRAAPGLAAHRFLFEETGGRLMERLGDIKREFPCVLDLGCREAGLARQIAARAGTRQVIAAGLAPPEGARAIVADEEFLPFASGSFDLIASNLALHWVNDLPGTLLQARACLKPGGLFIAALPGGATLRELRDCMMRAELDITGGASPRVSPAAGLRDAAALLQRANFALPVADSETIEVTYEDMFALMRDLRGMGEANAQIARLKIPTRRAVFMRAAEYYARDYAEAGGRIRTTFEIVWLHGWAE